MNERTNLEHLYEGKEIYRQFAMTEEEADAVFDLLVSDGGASEGMRFEFIHYHMQTPWHFPTEFRFQGKFGFGGKFWNRRNDWSVTGYNEDHPRVAAELAHINQQLKELRKKFRG